MKQLVCLQVHNDYLIPGGETKSAKLIASLLEKKGIKVIKYYKNNLMIKNGIMGKVGLVSQSLYNTQTIDEVEKIIQKEHVNFALIHNTSPLISNSIYGVLNKNNIPVFKYLQNYNLLCLNGAIDQGEHCIKCKKNSFEGVRRSCYKGSKVYSLQKYIAKEIFDFKYKETICGYIAISNYVKEKHIEYGLDPKKIDVIYHFIDGLDLSKGKSSAEEYIENDTYYLYMGRISKEKGIFTLIKSFESLSNVKLKIMGIGESYLELKNYVFENGLSNIEFLGYKDGEEKESIIKKAKALIVPSEWDEPFGRIVIESYQNGTPVIGTNRGGLPELIETSKTGFIFKAGSKSALIDTINRFEGISLQEYLSIRENCINMILTKFNEDKFFDCFINMLSNRIKF